MTRIHSHVQYFMRGRWKHSKNPCWVMKKDLCKNFPLCNRKLPSKKLKSIYHKKKGYCTKECYERHIDEDYVKQKLNHFLKEAIPSD